MSVSEKHRQLCQRLALIEDSQERLAAVLERSQKLPKIPECERTEARRIQGCVSRVWLIGEWIGDQCHFRIDAESALVRALAALVCEPFHEGSPAEILAHQGDILADLNLSAQLTPTRMQGLASVREAVRAFAAAHTR